MDVPKVSIVINVCTQQNLKFKAELNKVCRYGTNSASNYVFIGFQMRHLWSMLQVTTIFEPSHKSTFRRKEVEM